MLRLNQQNKPYRIIKFPNYEISKIKTGIVHLGIGAFHRAHQAFYTDQVLEKDGGDWAICGVSLKRPEVRDQMVPQDGLYSLVEQDEHQGPDRPNLGRHRQPQDISADAQPQAAEP